MTNRFSEKQLLTKVLFARTLDLDTFYDFFAVDKEFTEGGKKIIWDDIYRKHKNWANDIVKNNKTECKINYLANKNCDRKFGQRWGFQCMPRKLRAFYARDYYDDIDIVNAGPNILYYIATEVLKIEPDKITTLKDYATNPKSIRAKYNLEKNDMFRYYFFDTPTGKNKWTIQFAEECKLLQDEIWNQQLAYCTESIAENKKNPKGSYCSITYFKYESQILEKAIDMIGRKSVSTLIFDGFHLDKDNKYDIEKINDELPSMINFIRKPFTPDSPELIAAYEEYKETDTEDFISFTDIDDEWFVEQFFDRYKDYFRVDEDDNLYCRDVNGWKLDSKKKSVYIKAVELVRELKKDEGYQYMSESDAKAFKKYNNHNTINAFSNKVKNLMSVNVDEFIEESGNFLFFKNGYYDLDENRFYEDFNKYNLWSYEFDYDPKHFDIEDNVTDFHLSRNSRF